MFDETSGITPRRRLGRGLSALLGSGTPAPEQVNGGEEANLRHLSLELIERNPFQPRKDFDPAALGELVASVREHGILQPILVREVAERFQLIAGERRLIAAQKAGLATIPCRIVDVVDKTACEYALEENLKRRDLNDLEKALAFREYMQQFGTTADELAQQLSLNRSTVSNMIRLLELPEQIKQAVTSGKISSGHARALLSLSETDQLALCDRIISEGLSVRATEAAVRERLASTADANSQTLKVRRGKPEMTNHLKNLQQQLQDHLGCQVEIRLKTKDSGQIIIQFASNDEFERVFRQFRRAA